MDHLSIGKVGGRRRETAHLGRRRDGQHGGHPDRKPDRGKEAEHADGQDQADDDRCQADQADADADALEAAGKVGVQPLALTPGGIANRAAALVDLPRDPVEPGDCPFDLIRLVAHLASSGVSGELAPSSLPWFTPSARAM